MKGDVIMIIKLGDYTLDKSKISINGNVFPFDSFVAYALQRDTNSLFDEIKEVQVSFISVSKIDRLIRYLKRLGYDDIILNVTIREYFANEISNNNNEVLLSSVKILNKLPGVQVIIV